MLACSDSKSDIDLYVYTQSEIPIDERTQIAVEQSHQVEINNLCGEPGHAWFDTETGVGVDIMFRGVEWIEEKLDLVLNRHIASVGYSTCFWYSVLSSRVLHDRSGWFCSLQQRVDQPYPEELRRAIIRKNHPLLRRNMFSYIHQLELAVTREDVVSINHRVAALLASYFDIVFAVNRYPHPGEKRLVSIAEQRCGNVPEGMREQVNCLVRSISERGGEVMEHANQLIDGLDKFLEEETLYLGRGSVIP